MVFLSWFMHSPGTWSIAESAVRSKAAPWDEPYVKDGKFENEFAGRRFIRLRLALWAFIIGFPRFSGVGNGGKITPFPDYMTHIASVHRRSLLRLLHIDLCVLSGAIFGGGAGIAQCCKGLV
jgi:hypothetical protein